MDVSSIKPPINPTASRDVASSAPAVTDSQHKQGVPGVTPAQSTEEQGSSLVAQPTEEVSRDKVEEAVATIQEFVQTVRRSINFAVDDGSGRVVVKVTDAGSGDVIRQIPSEEALKLAENLTEVRSLLFKAEA
ncbi:Flagellar protein FlaG protein [Pseudomonas sp. 8Z]|uniref:flagellar protein FlaG n=1 Tax=Pseudomonas sp. 8Z TaxID=2653166 RepID=UPI0012F01C99|nr:flagellar protein FlaG [Pseudomonas sp. 8Z]VXC32490.1 Flagellar protein FlaG protein [Pseudomonas sp. 8Z]